MINTTLAALALVAGLDLSIPSNPKWQPNYSEALTRASAEKKPLAVFIGQGDAAKRMLADGTISAETAKLLSSSYVCLYLNTETAAGKELAGRFELKEGLVISSPGGSVQAYRYAGAVPAATLSTELAHYAAAGQPKTTISAGEVAAPAASGYVIPSGGCPNGNCPNQYLYPSSGTIYGGCPNGRCPNQR